MLNRTAAATAKVGATARHANGPRLLSLSPQVLQHRRASTSPQSPLSDNIVVQRALLTPISPSTFFAPLTPQALTPGLQQQRLENLTQCLISSVPAEIVYPHPSFGQMCSEAQNITSFLDLYRQHTTEEARLCSVKSPTSQTAGLGSWRAMEDIIEQDSGVRRRSAIRRSRSLSDLSEARLCIGVRALRIPWLHGPRGDKTHPRGTGENSLLKGKAQGLPHRP
ncbi:hypothetical protein NM688_g4980 [Phlebia brevispora]|uniref:Uncharacterized protein n=1 Tax=Phlebia brevispora TaxID=194682 RepID=A0ACC1T1H8_9APHY|nr:hypothetical protein NM688_g4980 [Phlebia brevispora]